MKKARNETLVELRKSVEKDRTKSRKYNRQLCQICNRGYNNINAHNRRVHQRSRRHQCDLCPLNFFTRREIRLHMAVHQKYREKNSLCVYCNKNFATEKSLKSHVDKIHLKQNLIYCERCGQAFVNSITYQTHVRHRHSGERPYKCDKCQYSGFSYGAIKDHIITFHYKKRYTCQYCLKVFRTEKTYSDHLLRYHKSLKYKCTYPDCQRVFSKSWDVRRHVEHYHLLVRNHQCNTCGEGFWKKASLECHIVSSHLKLKFSCEVLHCGAQYGSKKSLRLHIKRNHQDLDKDIVKQLQDNLRNIQIPNEKNSYS
jgi:KRAB domain-containing zinc finger protein